MCTRCVHTLWSCDFFFQRCDFYFYFLCWVVWFSAAGGFGGSWWCVSKGKYTIGLGQDCMAFCTELEDVISMRSPAILHNHFLITKIVFFFQINDLIWSLVNGFCKKINKFSGNSNILLGVLNSCLCSWSMKLASSVLDLYDAAATYSDHFSLLN